MVKTLKGKTTMTINGKPIPGVKEGTITFKLMKTIPAADTVNHPNHYNQGKIEVIEFLEDQFMNRPHEWNAVKYLARAAFKGREIEDLEKAIWYIRRKIELVNGSKKRPNEMPQERA